MVEQNLTVILGTCCKTVLCLHRKRVYMILFYNKMFFRSWLQLSFPMQFKSQKGMILSWNVSHPLTDEIQILESSCFNRASNNGICMVNIAVCLFSDSIAFVYHLGHDSAYTLCYTSGCPFSQPYPFCVTQRPWRGLAEETSNSLPAANCPCSSLQKPSWVKTHEKHLMELEPVLIHCPTPSCGQLLKPRGSCKDAEGIQMEDDLPIHRGSLICPNCLIWIKAWNPTL